MQRLLVKLPVCPHKRSVSCLQLLRGVTISSGGVLPRIHPELLSKKRGGRVKADGATPPPERPTSKKPLRKVKGQRGRKAKVSRCGATCTRTGACAGCGRGSAWSGDCCITSSAEHRRAVGGVHGGRRSRRRLHRPVSQESLPGTKGNRSCDPHWQEVESHVT